jgi:hypothetical protein
MSSHSSGKPYLELQLKMALSLLDFIKEPLSIENQKEFACIVKEMVTLLERLKFLAERT